MDWHANIWHAKIEQIVQCSQWLAAADGRSAGSLRLKSETTAAASRETLNRRVDDELGVIARRALCV